MSKLTAITVLLALTLTCASLPDPVIDNSRYTQELSDQIEEVKIDRMFNMISEKDSVDKINRIQEQIDNITKTK